MATTPNRAEQVYICLHPAGTPCGPSSDEDQARAAADHMAVDPETDWRGLLHPDNPRDTADYGPYMDPLRPRRAPTVREDGPDVTYCRACGQVALDHLAGQYSIYGVCPDPRVNPCPECPDGEVEVRPGPPTMVRYLCSAGCGWTA